MKFSPLTLICVLSADVMAGMAAEKSRTAGPVLQGLKASPYRHQDASGEGPLFRPPMTGVQMKE